VKTRVLEGIDLRIHEREFVSLTGFSGSGKSTLLYLLGALDKPTEGSVLVDGIDIVPLDDDERAELRSKKFGFVFQFHFLLPEFTVLENVMIPMRKRGARTLASCEERAREVIWQLGLGELEERRPGQLSGGQQQRVSIARALFLEPEIVLADEPTGNLDSRSGGEVLAILRDIASVDGRTVVMVTHDPAAAAIADRVVFLRDGRIAGGMESASTRQVAEGLAALTADPAAVA
jgi:lipoprotein-releasing system ATP-binding protein